MPTTNPPEPGTSGAGGAGSDDPPDNVPDEPVLPPFPARREGSYLPETPFFELEVAEAAINAQRPGRGTAALPAPPEQPRGPLSPVTVSSVEELESALAQGGVEITLAADLDFVYLTRAQDVLLRLDGHTIENLFLVDNLQQQPNDLQRLKILGPGLLGSVNGGNRFGGTITDVTLEGVWISGALTSPPSAGGLGFCGQRIALLYCIGLGSDPVDQTNGAWGIITNWNNDDESCTDVVIYGSNIAAIRIESDDGDNWAVRAAEVHRYWIVDSRLQSDSWRQANRFYDLTDSVPGYTTPDNVGTPRETTFVNTFHGHAMASIGTSDDNFNRGIFMKDFTLVSARRGGAIDFTLFGPHTFQDEGTWVIEGMHVITDAGHIDAMFVQSVEDSEGLNGDVEDFDLDFGDHNTYVADPSLVDPYADSSNWPMVVSPNVGLVGSNPYDTPPFMQ